MSKLEKRANGEGSIYQRKSDGKWVGSITLGDGKRKVFYGSKKSEVKEKVNKALNQQKQGILITEKDQTVKSYLEYWIEEIHKPTVRISTYVKYCKLLKHIIPELGNIKLQKLTPQQVQAFYSKKLKQGLGPKMVNSMHGVLHVALENAVKWNLVARNVCDAVSPPRIPRKEHKVLNKQQALNLIQHVKKHRLEANLIVALTTGIRRGEMLALRWSDIDFENGSVQIQRTVDYIPHYGYVETEPKSATGRRKIMLASFVVDILKVHRAEQQEDKKKVGEHWIEKDLIFCGLHGDYFNPNYLLRIFKKVLVEAGLPHMRWHDLRHSAATILLSMNIHPKIVQELLGHSTINMTLDVYSHAIPSMQKDITDGWDKDFESQ